MPVALVRPAAAAAAAAATAATQPQAPPTPEAAVAAAPPPPPPELTTAWTPSLSSSSHHHALPCAGPWTALWLIVALALSLVGLRRLVARRRQQQQAPREGQPFQPQQSEKDDFHRQREHALLQQRALHQQGLFWTMAAAPCHGTGAGTDTSATRSPPLSPVAPLPPLALPPLALPPPPLTAPALSSSIFRLDSRGTDAATAPPALDAQIAFMHQPNPDYAVDIDDTLDVLSAPPPTTAAAHTLPTAIASGRRSAAGSPRLRNYARVVPGVAAAPAASAAASAAELPAAEAASPHNATTATTSSSSTTTTTAPSNPTPIVRGEIISVLDDAGAGWTRHTRVYGGGVCLACLEAEQNGGGGGGGRDDDDDDDSGYGENVPLWARR